MSIRGGGFILQEEVASRVLLVVFWGDDVSSRGRRGWSSLEDLPVTSDLFLEEVAGREDGLHIRRGNSKGMSEDIYRGSRGGIILDSGDNGGLDYLLLRGRVVVFCMFLRNLLPLGVETSSVERGVGLPVTALPIYVSVGTGPILGEDEAIKAGLVGPFPTLDEGESRI